MRKLFPKVDWRTGDVLTAQHLRAQDRHFESLLGFHRRIVGLPTWGFSTLEIDENAFEEGNLRLLRAVGAFADGLAFDIPVSDDMPKSISLPPVALKTDRDLSVYLAIPETLETEIWHSETSNHLDPDEFGSSWDSRFRSSWHDPSSSEEPDNESVTLLSKNLRLLVLEEPRNMNSGKDVDYAWDARRTRPQIPDGLATLQVARLKRSGSGLFLDREFIPPLIDISASRYLWHRIASNLLSTMANRSKSYSSDFRPLRSLDVSTMNSIEIGRLSYLLALNSHYPLLRQLCPPDSADNKKESYTEHPIRLYEVMASLASSLGTFSPATRVTDLPTYDHADLGWTFTRLYKILKGLLDLEFMGSSCGFHLHPLSGQTRLAQTESLDPKYFAGSSIFLAVSGRYESEQLPDHGVDGQMLRDIELSWTELNAASQLEFANPITAGNRQEPACLRRRGYYYYPLPGPRPDELTAEIRLQGRWRNTWRSLDLELVFVFQRIM